MHMIGFEDMAQVHSVRVALTPKGRERPSSMMVMMTRCFLSLLTICGVQFVESARNFV